MFLLQPLLEVRLCKRRKPAGRLGKGLMLAALVVVCARDRVKEIVRSGLHGGSLKEK
jgi:hypothetical protein